MDHDHNKNPDAIDLPEPTGWPIVAAFGLTLLFFGLVTSWIISVCGLVVGIFGAVGWFLDVFPHPKHETVQLRPLAERAEPIRTAGRVVQILEEGHVPNRAHIPQEIHPYSVGVWGGAAGGLVMAVLACLLGLIVDHSIWYPVNLLAAAGVPDLADASLETLKAFSISGLIVGTITHVTMSLMIGLLYAAILPMFPRSGEWFWGGLVAPFLWSAAIYFTLHMISPKLAAGVNWIPFVICQFAFGLVCGFVVYRSGKMETMQSWSLPQKLGVEAQHRDPEEKK